MKMEVNPNKYEKKTLALKRTISFLVKSFAYVKLLWSFNVVMKLFMWNTFWIQVR